MDVIQVDAIGLQTLQAVVDAPADMAGAGPTSVTRVTAGHAHFGGKDQVIAVAADKFAENFFRGAVGVNISGVYQIDSAFAGSVVKLGRSLLISFAAKVMVPRETVETCKPLRPRGR